MLRWRVVFASLLAAVAVLAVAPGTAAAAAEEQISISGAEASFAFFSSLDINVTGSGVCRVAGPVTITVTLTNLDTGGTATGSITTACDSPGERVGWVVSVISSATLFRPGDQLNVVATATGAINDTDAKQTTLKQFR